MFCTKEKRYCKHITILLKIKEKCKISKKKTFFLYDLRQKWTKKQQDIRVELQEKPKNEWQPYEIWAYPMNESDLHIQQCTL